MKLHPRVILAVAGGLALAAATPALAQRQASQKSVTREQAIACIDTALAARQGRIKDLEIDVKNGKTMCEVEVIGADGRKVEVHVDVVANSVTRIDQ
jgi:uncharacterized membrane protein YkoI